MMNYGRVTEEAKANLRNFNEEELRSFLVKAGSHEVRYIKGGESKKGHIYPSQLAYDTSKKTHTINALMDLKGIVYGVLDNSEVVADIREMGHEEFDKISMDTTIGYVFNGNYYNPIKKREVNTLITEKGREVFA